MPCDNMPCMVGGGGNSDAPWHCARLGRALDAPSGMMPCAKGFSLWHSASRNRDPGAWIQAQGSSGMEDWMSSVPVPALHSEGVCISLT